MYSKKLWGIWVKYYKCKYLFPNCSNSKCTMTAFDRQLIINAFINKRSFPTPPTFSRSTWHPKSGCHVTSLCQGLRRSAGSGDEDPENQVAEYCEHMFKATVTGKDGHQIFNEKNLKKKEF